jgi:hypothetical protein
VLTSPADESLIAILIGATIKLALQIISDVPQLESDVPWRLFTTDGAAAFQREAVFLNAPKVKAMIGIVSTQNLINRTHL